MGLIDRLDRLERDSGSGSGRCEELAPWKDQARITGSGWRSDRLLEFEVPERCSTCAYRPVTIEVFEIEDQHSERAHRPK
jgi:hypothetical protein